jgi:8-oxo-dGTP pyrophosphatase MutT (NUDIX family)
MGFERIRSDERWKGRVLAIRVDTFRHDDGEEVEREYAEHPGAAAVVAHDGEVLYLVRQPREAVGEESLLEIPAGKLDQEGEGPLETAKRELVEEIGKGARTWEHLTTCYASPGFSDEKYYVYLATDLYDEEASEPDEDERIEIVTVPLTELDAAIEQTKDAKSLIGLLWFRAYSR